MSKNGPSDSSAHNVSPSISSDIRFFKKLLIKDEASLKACVREIIKNDPSKPKFYPTYLLYRKYQKLLLVKHPRCYKRYLKKAKQKIINPQSAQGNNPK